MTLRAMAKACDGELLYAKDDEADTKEAAMVMIDSRKVSEGAVFIATVGERVNGHSFIEQVFKDGALGVVCEELPDKAFGPCILVKDSFKALKDIAAYYRAQLECTVIGITGSVGKTSTKEFIATVLSEKYRVCKTIGNFNNEVGMPLTILSARETDEVLVLEMGINHFGEMERMSAIARPDMAVITNIANCHLEFLGDRDGVLRAKTAIFNGMQEGSRVFLNADDDKLATVDTACGVRPIFYGIQSRVKALKYYVSEYMTKGLMGTDAVVISRITGENIPISIRLPGEHMLYNALAATAVAEALHMNGEEIAAGIGRVKATAGRGNIISGKSYTIIDDCYNANPSAMKAALKLLGLADTRKVAILGDMFELGDGAKELHREVGEEAARSDIDVIICTGELSKAMYDGAMDVINKSHGKESVTATSNAMTAGLIYCKDKESLKEALPHILRGGDSVLVKASHGMGFGEIVDMLKEA